MAAPPAPLFVALSAAAQPGERLDKKLQLYFQSRRSGGGECDVEVEDLERGVYRVRFQSEEAKKRVQASEHHTINSHGQTLTLRVLQDSKVINSAGKPFSQSLTSQATRPPLSVSSTHQSLSSLEKMQLSDMYTDNPLTKKIFLRVSATLNTDLFTREERDQVQSLWPALKIEKVSSKLGVEEVTGDYDDVEELHHHFKKLLAKSDRSGEPTNPQRQNGLKSKAVNDQKEGSENDAEESFKMSVPSAIFEYFSHVYKGKIKDLEQRFNTKVISEEDGNGMTSVRFASAGSFVEKAQQDFVTAFQKVAADLKQEIISLTDIQQVNKTSDKLNTNFKSILVKSQGNALILRGPAKDLSDAKEFIKEMEAESLPEKPEVNVPKTSFLVDTDVFELLEPKLARDIQFIQQTYGILVEKKQCLSSSKTCITFKPETKKISSSTSKAREYLFRAYQKALEIKIEKVIPLKPESLRTLDEFLIHFQKENPRVFLEKKEDKLIIFGLPMDVCAMEKYILQFLNTNPAPHSGKLSHTHTAEAGTSSRANLENNSGCKGHSFPSGDPLNVKAAKAEPEEECPICMDRIDQKEVLPKCKHAFCRTCIKKSMKYKPVCPVCNMFYGKIEGNQPPGKMEISKMPSSLPGYKGSGTIVITYHIHHGTQNENHPNPGRRFTGVVRTAYLPDNKEGREVLQLLRRAFDQKLIFTVGQSRTTGVNDIVTWNDIHHKTTIHGGPNGYGYPDPDYLKRVREELKAKGIE